MKVLRVAAAFAVAAGVVAGHDAHGQTTAATGSLPRAVPNDNRKPAGTLRDGVLTLRLEAVMAVWAPDGPAGGKRTVQVFAEEGREPQVPGPLIRVPEGTELRVTITNRLAQPLKLRGMTTRPARADALVEIPAGERHDLKFEAGKAGTYFYWAATVSSAIESRREIDSQLSGAFIVDSDDDEEAADDRVFVITEWVDVTVQPIKFSAAINGASWPHTDRLTLPFGEAVHWRVINASFGVHPMHLHGTFYTVESRGDTGRDVIYGADHRRMVTTEMMEPGTTMRMRWVPDRVGNWLFHCHVLGHVSGDMRLGDMTPEEREAAAHHSEHDIERAMAGLVIGITVPPGDETAAPDLEPHERRRLTIRMLPVKPRYGTAPALGFEIFDGDGAPVPNFGPRMPPRVAQIGDANPSPPLVLTRGQPVTITLESRLAKETQIHWHGIELESYNDGVPGWSGHLRQITPAIAPGGRYEVQFTPPRAGTFIYHTHAHDRQQLSAGLYGALIVVEPDAVFNPEVERIVVLGGAGPDSEAIEVNRSTNPVPMDLKVGVKYRFRLINITPAFTAVVSLRGDGPVQWRPVSKDGADLPPSQTAPRLARQVISVGETYDFEYEPSAPGEMRLEIMKRVPEPILTSILVRVAR
jgi:manganese oxidase